MYRPKRRASALGIGILLVVSLPPIVGLVGTGSESSTAAPPTVEVVPAATALDAVPDLELASIAGAGGEPEGAGAPDATGIGPEAEAAPIMLSPAVEPPDLRRLAGGPLTGVPEPDASLKGARYRLAEPGFFAGLPVGLRADFDLVRDVWRVKGEAWGWQLPDYARVASHASGTGGSRPPPVHYDSLYAAALARVGGARPAPFGPNIYNEISPQGLVGVTTWYGEYFHGQVMRYGQIYDMFDPTTAACNVYPGGTRLRVTASNGRYVDVVVRDTGAFQYPIVTDLSWAAFAQLADPDWGVIDVVVEPIDQLAPDVLAAYGPPQAPFRQPPPPGTSLSASASAMQSTATATATPAGRSGPGPTARATATARPGNVVTPVAPTAVPTQPRTPTPLPITEPEPTATATVAPTRTPTRAPTQQPTVPPTAVPTATLPPTVAPTATRPPATPTPPPTRTPTPPAENTPIPRPSQPTTPSKLPTETGGNNRG